MSHNNKIPRFTSAYNILFIMNVFLNNQPMTALRLKYTIILKIKQFISRKVVIIMAQEKGSMTVQEAGKKGGDTVKRKYGHEFYETIGKKGGEIRANDEDIRSGKIGRMGGQKVKQLIEAGKKALGQE
jgi:general stress protein YciG